MADPRRPRAERTILAAFGLTTLASVGFAAVYALGGQVQLEGVLLGLAFAGLGVGFATWTRDLLPHGPWVEEHEAFEPTPRERLSFEDELERDIQPVGRRRLLMRLLGLALGSLGLAALFPLRSLGPRPPDWLYATPWRSGVRMVTEDGVPVLAKDIQPGQVVTVFPEGHTDAGNAPTVLTRVDPALLSLPAGRAGWTPGGLVAYSKLCTHLGCPVGLYEKESQRLFCPCHQSAFDILNAATPLSGPATRPLPQLPVQIGPDGVLRAGGAFSDTPGPEFWSERPR